MPRVRQRRRNPPLLPGMAFDSPYPRCRTMALAEQAVRDENNRRLVLRRSKGAAIIDVWSMPSTCPDRRLAAAIGGASERSIMNQTGHRSVQMVRRYIRDGSLFRENSAGKLGL